MQREQKSQFRVSLFHNHFSFCNYRLINFLRKNIIFQVQKASSTFRYSKKSLTELLISSFNLLCLVFFGRFLGIFREISLIRFILQCSAIVQCTPQPHLNLLLFKVGLTVVFAFEKVGLLLQTSRLICNDITVNGVH